MPSKQGSSIVVVLLLTIAPSLSACREGGLLGPLVQEAKLYSDTLAEAARPISRALVAQAGQTFGDSVSPVLDSAAVSLLRVVEARVGPLQDSVAVFVAADLSRALSTLLDENLVLVRGTVSSTLDDWVAGLSSSARTRLVPVVDGELAPALGAAADTTVARAMARFAADLERGSPLRESVVGLTDTVVVQAVQAIDRSTREADAPWWVWALFIGFGLLVVGVVGTFIVRLVQGLRRRDQSLRTVTAAIKESGDVEMKELVKQKATERGVEPWLHSYLRENRLLMEG